jgi:TolA-binding protein
LKLESRLNASCVLRAGVALGLAAALGGTAGAQNQGDFAQRQYDSGLEFMQNQRYVEALKDLQVVVDSFPKSAVADDALMQTALYHLDVARDLEAARTAADRVLREYPESDSAPMAYVITGRLTMARARTPADVDAALASFERVPRLFPASEAVAAARFHMGEALRRVRRPDEAANQFRRVPVEFPRSIYAARSALASAAALPPPDRIPRTMADLQRVRLQFPKSTEAVVALNLNTILHRLYMRPPAQSFRFSGRSIGAENSRYRDVVGLAVDRAGRVLMGHRQEVTVFDANAAVVTSVPGDDPTAFFLDEADRIFVVQRGLLVNDRGLPLAIKVASADGRSSRLLEDVPTVVALSTGDRLVADRRQRVVLRLNPAGEVLGTFTSINARRMVVSADDDVAIIDRDARTVLVADRDGKQLFRLAAKGTGYELSEPVDLAFDVLGHLYVLDGDKPVIHVFRPGGALVTSLVASDPAVLQRPRALTVDGAGRLLLYDDRLQRIQIFQ